MGFEIAPINGVTGDPIAEAPAAPLTVGLAVFSGGVEIGEVRSINFGGCFVVARTGLDGLAVGLAPAAPAPVPPPAPASAPAAPAMTVRAIGDTFTPVPSNVNANLAAIDGLAAGVYRLMCGVQWRAAMGEASTVQQTTLGTGPSPTTIEKTGAASYVTDQLNQATLPGDFCAQRLDLLFEVTDDMVQAGTNSFYLAGRVSYSGGAVSALAYVLGYKLA